MPHHGDLCNTIRLIANAADQQIIMRLHPARNANFLWHWFHKDPANRGRIVRNTYSAGDLIRKTHNFYGWRAEATHPRRGVCSGTLYRTAGYMHVALDERVGQGAGRNIHIEHTVPVRVLENALALRVGDLETPCDLHDFLMRYSVCVAFSRDEQRAMNGIISSHGNPAFDDAGSLLSDCPFLRYVPFLEQGVEFEILDVVTRTAIDLRVFTFADHVRTLERASRLVKNNPDACDLYYASRFPAVAWKLA